jgi:hypothetical protein
MMAGGKLCTVRAINVEAGCLARPLHPFPAAPPESRAWDGAATAVPQTDEQERHVELTSRVPAFLLSPEL